MKPKILIVEDDPVIQNIISKIMSMKEYSFSIAVDGFEAGFKISQDKPDLVILDIRLPDIDGYEVARRLRDVGVENTHIMQPYGLNGWKDAGLPLATDDPKSDGQALERLGFCAKHPVQCMGGKS